MKKLIFSIITLISVLTANAECMKQIRLSFNKTQFAFVKDSIGTTRITTNEFAMNYGSDISQPGLPFIAINVAVPNGAGFDGMDETHENELLFSNVVIARNPISIPNNYEGNIPQLTLPTYEQSTYPNNNAKYVGTSHIGDYNVLRFIVCPFEYDTKEKTLYLANDMTLNIRLKDSPSAMFSENTFTGNNMEDIVKSQIINAKDFENSRIETQDLSIGNLPSLYQPTEYLIITSEELSSHFKPLALWKKMKGVKSQITTVENIKKLHPETDTQLAIKTYIWDMYKNQGLKYVLLGGDDSVVPVRGCYIEAGGKKGDRWYICDEAMPTDLYYACFDGDFSWDSNKNGIYGEYSDSISLDPSVFITRAPVRSIEDTEAFVNKILGYEKNPTKNGWNNNILLSGSKIFEYVKEGIIPRCDSEYKSQYLYKNSIKPYWNGGATCLYDIASNTSAWETLGVTGAKLQEKLSQGFTFFDMMTHGMDTTWLFQKSEAYDTSYAKSLTNPNYTIITTTACLTNAFDSYKNNKQEEIPCLSESFIRNPNSGIVAYLGCSRVGWEALEPKETGTSSKYEQKYYEYLFSQKLKNKNFGAIVAAAKSTFINFCQQDSVYRWIQFGLNPIGDPEMPIYTTTPKEIPFCSITYGIDGKTVYVNAGTDSCRICLMSQDEGKTDYIVLKNRQKAEFTPTSPSTICITKQNYIPYINTIYPPTSSSSSISLCTINPSNNTATVSAKLADGVKDAKIIITSISANMQKTSNISADNQTTVVDVSNYADGIITASLLVNGKIVDSKNIIK